jgi:hypothetical protein
VLCRGWILVSRFADPDRPGERVPCAPAYVGTDLGAMDEVLACTYFAM